MNLLTIEHMTIAVENLLFELMVRFLDLSIAVRDDPDSIPTPHGFMFAFVLLFSLLFRSKTLFVVKKCLSFCNSSSLMF